MLHTSNILNGKRKMLLKGRTTTDFAQRMIDSWMIRITTIHKSSMAGRQNSAENLTSGHNKTTPTWPRDKRAKGTKQRYVFKVRWRESWVSTQKIWLRSNESRKQTYLRCGSKRPNYLQYIPSHLKQRQRSQPSTSVEVSSQTCAADKQRDENTQLSQSRQLHQWRTSSWDEWWLSLKTWRSS